MSSVTERSAVAEETGDGMRSRAGLTETPAIMAVPPSGPVSRHGMTTVQAAHCRANRASRKGAWRRAACSCFSAAAMIFPSLIRHRREAVRRTTLFFYNARAKWNLVPASRNAALVHCARRSSNKEIRMRELFVALGFVAAFAGPAVAACQRHNGSERRHPREERLQTKRDRGEMQDPYWMPCDYYSSTGVNSCD